MSKLLDVVLKRKKTMDISWMEDFEDINVDKDLKFIYKNKEVSFEKANTMLSFIVLAYDPYSSWIEMHKNRLDNKRNIMERLGGDIEDKFYKGVINGSNLMSQDLKAWFMRYIRNWKWDTIMTCFDYHAEMMEFGGFRTLEELETTEIEIDEDNKEREVLRRKEVSIDKLAKGNIDKGDSMEKGLKMRLKGEELWEEIKKEYMTTDTVLEREGRMRITDATDIESWEQFIRSLKKADKQ